MSERINSRKCVRLRAGANSALGTEHTKTKCKRNNVREYTTTFITIAKMQIATQIIAVCPNNHLNKSNRIAFCFRLRWMRLKITTKTVLHIILNGNIKWTNMLNNSIMITCYYIFQMERMFSAKSIYILY